MRKTSHCFYLRVTQLRSMKRNVHSCPYFPYTLNYMLRLNINGFIVFCLVSQSFSSLLRKSWCWFVGVDRGKWATFPLHSNRRQRETTCKWSFTCLSAATWPSVDDIIPWAQVADPTGSREINFVLVGRDLTSSSVKVKECEEAGEDCVRFRDYNQGFAIKKTLKPHTF